MRPATLKVFFKYFVKISNLEIVRNFKLFFLAEYIQITILECNIYETLVANTADKNSKN